MFCFSTIKSATFANFRVTIKQIILLAADSRVHLEPAKKSQKQLRFIESLSILQSMDLLVVNDLPNSVFT